MTRQATTQASFSADRVRGRAVAYYRSSPADPEGTIEAQREQVREWAEKHELEIIREFEDRGESGLDTESHPGFDELMRRVKKDRNFRYVLCPDVTRWACRDGRELPERHSHECLIAAGPVSVIRGPP